MKYWWPLFLVIKFTFVFLNLAKIHIKVPMGGEGSAGLGNIPKNTNNFFTASLKSDLFEFIQESTTLAWANKLEFPKT